MTDETEPDECKDLIPPLFGLITARFEDAAARAAKGQNPASDHVAIISDIAAEVEEADILRRTIEALVCTRSKSLRVAGRATVKR